jgi:hypothetical protein
MQPTAEGLLDLALAYHLAGDQGGELSACEQATCVEPGSGSAWSRYAHGLARTDRVGDCIDACERALALAPDGEVAALLHRMRQLEPRVLPAA